MDLSSWSREELEREARTLGVSRPGNKTRSQLIHVIDKARGRDGALGTAKKLFKAALGAARSLTSRPPPPPPPPKATRATRPTPADAVADQPDAEAMPEAADERPPAAEVEPATRAPDVAPVELELDASAETEEAMSTARALSDAASRMTRSKKAQAPPQKARASKDDVVPEREPIRTRTMAKLLSQQGYHRRALAIYEDLLEMHPDDEELAAAVTKAQQRAGGSAKSNEDSSQVVSVAVNDTTVLVAWELSDARIARARRLLAGAGDLEARLVVVAPHEAGVREETRTQPAENRGEWVVEGLPAGARATASVGLATAERFVSVGHASILRP